MFVCGLGLGVWLGIEYIEFVQFKKIIMSMGSAHKTRKPNCLCERTDTVYHCL